MGQEETVGESSVSSGCWGEDSDHKYGWARRTPTFVAPIRFFITPSDFIFHHIAATNSEPGPLAASRARWFYTLRLLVAHLLQLQ